MDKKITVVIPCRKGETAELTLKSLQSQRYQGFTTVLVIDYYARGASWARNRGFLEVHTPYVLFSDNDIKWEEYAFDYLLARLETNKEYSYSYGWYERGYGVHVGRKEFRPRLLAKDNYISTMSLIRTDDFPGFDENLKRLQDHDLWLTMLRQKKIGVFVDKKMFWTAGSDNGITAKEDLKIATEYLRKKHNLIP